MLINLSAADAIIIIHPSDECSVGVVFCEDCFESVGQSRFRFGGELIFWGKMDLLFLVFAVVRLAFSLETECEIRELAVLR